MQAAIQTQIDFAKGLYGSFNAISNNLDNINSSFNKQAGLLTQLTEALNKSTENFGRINVKLESLNNKLESIIPKNISDDIKNETKKLENKGKKLDKEVEKALKESQIKKDNKLLTAVKMSRKAFGSLSSSVLKAKKSLGNFTKTAENSEEAKKGLRKLASWLKETPNGSSSSRLVNAIKIALNSLKFLFSVFSNVIGSTFQFLKMINTLPYQIAKVASQFGNALRKDVVEVLGNAYEESKNFFDATSNIGKGALTMKKYATGSLSAMQSANSKFTKMFGFGTQAGAAFQKYIFEATNSMGHFAELFGPAVMKGGEAGFYLIESMKTLNISNEQLAYYAQDADVHTGNLFKTLDNTRDAISTASSSHGLDFKMLATNFHKLRTNIIDFGHLTSDAVADLTARATKMGVKAEELTNIFKKFTTFEDAASASAKLFQSFGMGIDALSLLTANDPGEILEMLSDSMQATGKTFDTLNRHERRLMQETTGLSAETLKSIMNYRAQGLSFEEARKKVQENDPTEEMTKTVKGLTSAIKQIQKIMEFKSPFDAFFKGLKANTLANGQSIQSLTGLSAAYDRLYHFGLTLDKKSINAMLIPVTAVIERLHAIFTSSDFLNTLSFGVSSIGDLFQNVTRNFAGGKLNKDLNILYDKLSALAYGQPGNEKQVKVTLSNALMTIKDDSDLKKYLISSGIINESTGKLMSTVGYDTIMQTLINAGNKFPSAKNDLNTIVTTINNDFKDKALDGIGWSSLGIKGRVDRVKQSLKRLWNKSSPWLKGIFELGGTIMGALIKGTVVGLTAIMKLMSGEVVDYYDQSNSVLLSVMKKAAASQGKLEKFNKGEYGLLDFLGLPTDFNESVLNRLRKTIMDFIFSPALYSTLGSLTYAIYDSLLPAVQSFANVIMTQVAKMIDNKGGVTSVLADIFFPELTAAGRAAQSKEPQKVANQISASLAKTNKKIQAKDVKARGDTIEVNTADLQKMQSQVTSGEFDPNEWIGGVFAKSLVGIGTGVATYFGTTGLLGFLGGLSVSGTTLGAATLSLGANLVAAGSSMGIISSGGLGLALSSAGAVLSSPVIVGVAAAAVVGTVGYLAWDYWFGEGKIIEAKKKKAIAQTEAFKVMEENFKNQLKIKQIRGEALAKFNDRWSRSSALFNQQKDKSGVVDYEHAHLYPAGYLYPLYSVTSGMNEKISLINYLNFGQEEDNVKKIKDGIIKSLPGKGLVFFDGRQNILFDENDTVELIASKKGGALMEYFNQIDKKYENNIKTLRSSLFDNAKETISLIEKDIKEKAKIADVIDKTTKVINKIISYNENDQKLTANISVQGA